MRGRIGSGILGRWLLLMSRAAYASKTVVSYCRRGIKEVGGAAADGHRSGWKALHVQQLRMSKGAQCGQSISIVPDRRGAGPTAAL